jgi:hypothetical protein
MIEQQFEMSPIYGKQKIQDLLVADAFTLGYVFGFADEASKFFLAKKRISVREAYVLKTLSDLIGNENAGDTLFRYAQTQLKERHFHKGYREALKDFDEWVEASGGSTPIGLSVHLEKM